MSYMPNVVQKKKAKPVSFIDQIATGALIPG